MVRKVGAGTHHRPPASGNLTAEQQPQRRSKPMFTVSVSIGIVRILGAGLPLLVNRFGDRPMTTAEIRWVNALVGSAVAFIGTAPALTGMF